jgi:hypothetical protein
LNTVQRVDRDGISCDTVRLRILRRVGDAITSTSSGLSQRVDAERTMDGVLERIAQLKGGTERIPRDRACE